ncbi:hypothetical protein [Microbacterium arborescens]
MNTDRRYADSQQTPVPYPSYRCKAKAHAPGKGAHACKLHADHSGEHRCVCGRRWEPVGVHA